MVKHQQIKKGSAPPSTRKPMLTAGKILRARRNELGISLKKISQETKVREDYLDMIEKDQYDSFDSKVFVNGFIKIYADYMGLDEDKVTALYRRSIDENIKVSQKPTPQIKETGRTKRFDLEKLLTPRNALLSIAAIFILGLISYLSIQFYNFNKAPILTITSHETVSTTTEETITLEGKTEEGVTIFINDDEINVEENLTFKQELPLFPGSNTITIKAVKKSNTQSETIKAIEITLETDSEALLQQPETTEETIPDKYIATLSTIGGEAWISMTIDGNQEVAQVLPIGYSEEFEITEELTLSTGRPSNTLLKINGETVQLSIDTATGTAGTNCVIRTTGFTCN